MAKKGIGNEIGTCQYKNTDNEIADAIERNKNAGNLGTVNALLAAKQRIAELKARVEELTRLSTLVVDAAAKYQYSHTPPISLPWISQELNDLANALQEPQG